MNFMNVLQYCLHRYGYVAYVEYFKTAWAHLVFPGSEKAATTVVPKCIQSVYIMHSTEAN